AQLRVFLWSQLPGCARHTAVVAPADEGSSGAVDAGGPAEVAFLSALWAEVGGADRADASENYWQSFSFLDAVARAAEAGVHIDDDQVTRNRTVTTLATDLAAGSVGRQSCGRDRK
ncbi:MAG: hypothetical protein M3011_04455, partial [Actinomycetota bacterium]|nr:hypothetical protein [Actinomycetota bacterium]